jgi:Winged helix DNA-binding domain
VASSAELAIRLRRQTSRPGEVARALAEGRLIKTWAMRGALHLLTPEEGGALLAIMAAGRSWERPAWTRYFGMTPERIERLRVAAREALDGKVLTRDELVDAVTRQPGLADIGEALRSSWGTVFKPLAWQGDLCFGPSQGNRTTFMLPSAASTRWAGLPDPEDAAPIAIRAYFGAFGPASIDTFGFWMAGGWFGKRRLRVLFGAVGDRLAQVEVDGEPLYMLSEHLDELASTKPTETVRLLGGFDQYVLGPGTADHHVVPAGRRSVVSRQAGWISPVVVAGGVVSGTWDLDGGELRIGWFTEAGAPPRRALEAEVARLSTILDRDLRAVMAKA